MSGDQSGRLAQNAANLAAQSTWGAKPLRDVLTADFDVDDQTTGATPTATGLSVTVVPSTTYLFEANLFATATTNGGIELSLSYPSGTTGVWQVNYFQDTAVVTNDGENAIGDLSNYIAAALSFDVVKVTGYIVVSTTGGTFALLGAQNTAHADNTIIHEGSSMTLTPVVTA